MQMKVPAQRAVRLGFIVLFFVLVTSITARAQFWDKLTKPQVTLNVTHAPGLGLNIKRVAFGPPTGECSAEAMDLLSRMLTTAGIETVDRQTAHQMGRAPGSTVKMMANISRCEPERRRDFSDKKQKDGTVERTFHAVIIMHIRGSLVTVDPATGAVLSSIPLDQDAEFANHSREGKPEFPSVDAARDEVLGQLINRASPTFIPWSEEKRLTFFNDKECNLSGAWALMKGGDFQGAVRQSEENIAACPTWPKVKDDTMAHAYYNAGVSYLMVNDSEKALAHLNQSAKLKGGDIVSEAIGQVRDSVNLAIELQQVAARTQTFEQDHARARDASRPIPANDARPDRDKGSHETVEVRLSKLKELRRQGLITQQEFDAKRAEILKGL